MSETPTLEPNDEMRRALAFEAAIDAGEATRAEPTPFGMVYLTSDYPIYYDGNFMTVDRDDATVEGLLAEGDRLLGAAGLEHRHVVAYDEVLGRRLAPGFAEAGFEVARLVFMGLHRPMDRTVDTSMVDELTWDEMAPLRAIETRAEPYANDDETVRQLVDRNIATGRATHVRHYAARAADGIHASLCDLYSDGSVAQVEDVGTFEAHRNQGLARATVSRVLEVATSENHEFVFIVADDEDTPKDLYAKLGFDPIGYTYDFTLPTEADKAAEAASRQSSS